MIKRLSSGIIVKSTYGREIVSVDDDYVKLASDSVSSMTALGVPGLNPVDLFPFCEYLRMITVIEILRIQCIMYLRGSRERSS